MNQQSPAGSAGTQISAKRKRGRPRKEDVPAPPEKLTPLRAPTVNIGPLNAPQFASGAPFQPQPSASASSNGNNTDDLQIGQPVTGVLEGTFDAGYLLSVQVGEGRPPLRGLVFKPGKFVPVTSENDVAPSVKMHHRMSFSEPPMNPVAPDIMKTEVEQTVGAEPSYVPAECESSVAQDVVKEVCREQDEKIIVEDSMECEGQGSSERKEAETGNGRYEGGNTGPKLELSLCSSFETPVVAVGQPEAGDKEKSITVEIQQENHQEQQMPGAFMDADQAQKTSIKSALEGEHVGVGEPGVEEPKMDETTGLLDTISPESIQLPEGVPTASAEPVLPPETIGASQVEPVLPPQATLPDPPPETIAADVVAVLPPEATLPDPVPPPPESNELNSPELGPQQEGGKAASAEEITAEPVEEKGPEEPEGTVGDI